MLTSHISIIVNSVIYAAAPRKDIYGFIATEYFLSRIRVKKDYKYHLNSVRHAEKETTPERLGDIEAKYSKGPHRLYGCGPIQRTPKVQGGHSSKKRYFERLS